MEDITRCREHMNFTFLPQEHKIHIFEVTCNIFFRHTDDGVSDVSDEDFR